MPTLISPSKLPPPPPPPPPQAANDNDIAPAATPEANRLEKRGTMIRRMGGRVMPQKASACRNYARPSFNHVVVGTEFLAEGGDLSKKESARTRRFLTR
jgi:hypothetical protein